MTNNDLARLLERYIGAWNDPDPARRAAAARKLWAPDGALINARQEYRGHEAVIRAIARSYERFVSDGYRYRAREGTTSHHDGVCLLWEMLDPEGSVDSAGANFLLFDRDRRIRLDYQFVEPKLERPRR
jgi:SnoaL-like domain